MIFSTINQFNCFLIFLFFGIISNLIYSLFSIIFIKNYQKKFKNIIFDTIFYVFLMIFLIFLINFLNFGKLSFSILLAFILGFYSSKILTKNLVVFLQNKWYTIFNKIFPKGAKHNASKSKKS